MSSFLEIVELVNGDIVLQRADGEGEALMTIHFSDESKAYLPEGRLEVARAMIHAGIETASQLEIVRSEPVAHSASVSVEAEVLSESLSETVSAVDADASLADDLTVPSDRVLH